MTAFLLIVGIILLAVEIFVAGFGVCGILGLTLVISASIIAILTIPFGIIIPAVQIGIIVAVGFYVYRYIKRKQLYGKLVLTDFLSSDKKEVGQQENLVGKVGVSKTALRPQGTVEINGSSLDVYSESGYIAPGTKVVVTSVSGTKLYVAQAKQ